MSASFYERILLLGDYAEDGGEVSIDAFAQMCACYESGKLAASYIKEYHTAGTSDPTSNESQQADIQDILDTLPGTLTVVTGVDFGIPPSVTTVAVSTAGRDGWAFHISSVLNLAVNGYDGFATVNDLKAKLGVT